jgi:hypothetical protein
LRFMEFIQLTLYLMTELRKLRCIEYMKLTLYLLTKVRKSGSWST